MLRDNSNSENNISLLVTNKYRKNLYSKKKKLEAGIILQGWEVKGARKNSPQIKKSFVITKNNKILLINSIFLPYIPRLGNNNSNKIYSKRIRELLLKKKEIIYIKNFKKEKGTTVLVTKLYWKKNFIKAELALVKSKNI